MTKTLHYTRTILTSDSGTGSVNLPGTPVSSIQNLKVAKGTGDVTIEPVGTGCRLMVTGGTLDGEVTLTWDMET